MRPSLRLLNRPHSSNSFLHASLHFHQVFEWVYCGENICFDLTDDYTTNTMNKNFILLVSYLTVFFSTALYSQSNLEMAKITGDGNPTADGPTKSAQTVFFVKNTTANNFELYNARPLSATFEVVNEQYAATAPDNQSSINFGKALPLGGRSLYAPLNVFGPNASDNHFTTSGDAAGAGYSRTANYGLNMVVSTQPLKATAKATSGEYHMADLKITFNRPVNNPVLHLAGLGQSTETLGFATRLELVTSNIALNLLSLERRSGNDNNKFKVDGKSILNGNTDLSGTTNQGHGSVRINGSGITTLTFKVLVKGDGKAGSTVNSWVSDSVSGDGIVMSLSTLESDLQVTNTVSDAQPTLGQDVTFTVVAKNNGPSANTGISVQNKLPARYQFVSKSVPTGTTYDENTGLWTIGALADAASTTLTITAKVLFAGTTTSQATITSTGGLSDPNVGNNLSSAVNACVTEVGSQPFNIPATEGAKSFFIARPLANKGFVMDITKLDNSFKLSVNNVYITTNELEFQSEGTPEPKINVEFVDGTQYEVGTGAPGNRSIWQLIGTASAPMLRVVISDAGAVTLFGSKTSGGPLFPLKLKTGGNQTTIFNNVSVANNSQIRIEQRAQGPTGIEGRAYAINSAPCVCYNDANTSYGLPTPTRHGITLLKRAGAGNNDNWPMNRNSAFTALESNTRGFVITRMATSALSNITAPQDGMMVYDTTENCLKIYTVNESAPANSAWKCYSVPSCP